MKINEILRKSSGKMQQFMIRSDMRKAEGVP